MKIMTIALAAASLAAFATTATTSLAAPRGERAAATQTSPGAGQSRRKTRPVLRRRCQPIYTRICYKGLPCRYLVTGYACRLN